MTAPEIAAPVEPVELTPAVDQVVAKITPLFPAKDPKPEHKPILVPVGSVVIKIYPTWKGGRSGGPYTIKHYDAAGKRVSTMRAELAEARSYATTIGTQISNRHQVMDSMTRADQARLAFCDEAVRNTGRTLEQAAVQERESDEALKKAGIVATRTEITEFFIKHHGRIVRKLVREIVAEFLAAKRAGTFGAKKCSAKYLATLESHLESQETSFAAHFQIPLEDVMAPDIAAWLGARRTAEGEPVCGVTWRGYRSSISALETFAKFKGYISEGRKELKRLQMPFAGRVKKTILTPAEMVKLTNAALAQRNTEMVVFVALGGFAGVRHAEISRLDWSDINFKQKVIVIRDAVSKTGHERFITMRENLIAWLLPYRRDSGPVCSVRNTSNALSRIKINAGLPHGKGETRNTLRRTWESYDALLSRNIEETVGQAGHSQAVAKKHYIRAQLIGDARKHFKIFPPETLKLEYAP